MARIYAPKTRVIPNSDGVFTISFLNASVDMILNARKPVGILLQVSHQAHDQLTLHLTVAPPNFLRMKTPHQCL